MGTFMRLERIIIGTKQETFLRVRDGIVEWTNNPFYHRWIGKSRRSLIDTLNWTHTAWTSMGWKDRKGESHERVSKP